MVAADAAKHDQKHPQMLVRQRNRSRLKVPAIQVQARLRDDVRVEADAKEHATPPVRPTGTQTKPVRAEGEVVAVREGPAEADGGNGRAEPPIAGLVQAIAKQGNREAGPAGAPWASSAALLHLFPLVGLVLISGGRMLTV